MTPAIPDGYEIASNDSHGARVWDDTCNKWEPVATGYHCRTYLSGGNIYIAPIRLRIGENYRCRNGRETGSIVQNQYCSSVELPFWSNELCLSYAKNGRYYHYDNAPETSYDIVGHIPKEKKMEKEHLIEVNLTDTSYLRKPKLCVSEAARIAQLPEVIAEVERQKREKEIKVGDWFQDEFGVTDKCLRFGAFGPEIITGLSGKDYTRRLCTKIPGPPEFIAMLEAGVKK